MSGRHPDAMTQVRLHDRRIGGPHRRLRVAGAMAGAGLRTALVPREATRRRGRAQVCGAARILTALGVRVRVLPPAVPWPRTGGQLVVSGSVGRVDRLAVLTAVPRGVAGWVPLAEHALLGAPAPVVPPHAGVVLPVTVRYRRGGTLLDVVDVPRDLVDVLATADLVVEVHLLPAVTA